MPSKCSKNKGVPKLSGGGEMSDYTGDILSSGLAGASTGAAFGPIGTGVGAAVGLAAGIADASKMKDQINQAEEQKANYENQMLNSYGPAAMGYLAGGGTPRNTVNIEGGETVVKGDGTVHEMKGPKHNDGGMNVNLSSNDYVFSAQLGPDGKNGKSYAALSKEIKSLYEGREMDKPAMESMKRQIASLREKQEADLAIQKLRKKTNPEMAGGGDPRFPGLTSDNILKGLETFGTYPYAGDPGGFGEFDTNFRNFGTDMGNTPSAHNYAQYIQRKNIAGMNTGITPRQDMNPMYSLPPTISNVQPTSPDQLGNIGKNVGATASVVNGRNTIRLPNSYSNQYPAPGQPTAQPSTTQPNMPAYDPMTQRARDKYSDKNTLQYVPRDNGLTQQQQARLASKEYYDAVKGYQNKSVNVDNTGQTSIDVGGITDQIKRNANIGAGFNMLGPAAQLAMTIGGPETENFQRISPAYADPTYAQTLADRQGALARANMNRGIAGAGNSRGQLLANTVQGNVGLGTGVANAKLGVQGQYDMYNTGVKNQVNQANAQISMQEDIANAQNRAAHRNFIGGAATDAGTIMSNKYRDTNMFLADDLYNQRMLNTLNSPYLNYTINPDGTINYNG